MGLQERSGLKKRSGVKSRETIKVRSGLQKRSGLRPKIITTTIQETQQTNTTDPRKEKLTELEKQEQAKYSQLDEIIKRSTETIQKLRARQEELYRIQKLPKWERQEAWKQTPEYKDFKTKGVGYTVNYLQRAIHGNGKQIKYAIEKKDDIRRKYFEDKRTIQRAIAKGISIQDQRKIEKNKKTYSWSKPSFWNEMSPEAKKEYTAQRAAKFKASQGIDTGWRPSQNTAALKDYNNKRQEILTQTLKSIQKRKEEKTPKYHFDIFGNRITATSPHRANILYTDGTIGVEKQNNNNKNINTWAYDFQPEEYNKTRYTEVNNGNNGISTRISDRTPYMDNFRLSPDQMALAEAYQAETNQGTRLNATQKYNNQIRLATLPKYRETKTAENWYDFDTYAQNFNIEISNRQRNLEIRTINGKNYWYDPATRVLLNIGEFTAGAYATGAGVVTGVTSATKYVFTTNPKQYPSDIKWVWDNKNQIWKAIKDDFLYKAIYRPYRLTGEIAGGFGVGYAGSKAYEKGTDAIRKIGAKELQYSDEIGNPLSTTNKNIEEQAEEFRQATGYSKDYGEIFDRNGNKITVARNPDGTFKKVSTTEEELKGVHATASKGLSKSKEINSERKRAGDDPGVFIKPKGEADPFWFGLGDYEFSFNPFTRSGSPNIVEIGYKNMKTLPEDVVQQAWKIRNTQGKAKAFDFINEWYKANAEPGDAYIPLRSVMKDTPEKQGIIPPQDISLRKPEGFLGTIKGYNEYVMVNGKVVPKFHMGVGDQTVTGIGKGNILTNLQKAKLYDDIMYYSSGGNYATKVTPYKGLSASTLSKDYSYKQPDKYSGKYYAQQTGALYSPYSYTNQPYKKGIPIYYGYKYPPQTPPGTPYYPYTPPEKPYTPPYIPNYPYYPPTTPPTKGGKTIITTTYQRKEKKRQQKKKEKQLYTDAWLVYTGDKGRLKESIIVKTKDEAENAARDIVDRSPDTAFKLKAITVHPRYIRQWTARNRHNYKFTRKRNTYYEKPQYQNDYENNFLMKALRAA